MKQLDIWILTGHFLILRDFCWLLGVIIVFWLYFNSLLLDIHPEIFMDEMPGCLGRDRWVWLKQRSYCADTTGSGEVGTGGFHYRLCAHLYICSAFTRANIYERIYTCVHIHTHSIDLYMRKISLEGSSRNVLCYLWEGKVGSYATSRRELGVFKENLYIVFELWTPWIYYLFKKLN